MEMVEIRRVRGLLRNCQGARIVERGGRMVLVMAFERQEEFGLVLPAAVAEAVEDYAKGVRDGGLQRSGG